ncbi:hypothetical protein HYFRA_00004932 [Hymenoscyphus fraxineus]|uniref:Uncharacterized protein n=1 Tax=Hymenoscyphus fraxineus TaxID=746836 RepID=A0A9N9KLS6_9HELO|nr:hypothetical protein HYFRA_00004932 [Hymenoscyphus fraxineus]
MSGRFKGFAQQRTSDTTPAFRETTKLQHTKLAMSIFGMPSSKKEKHYANSHARRHSGTVVISGGKKSKKNKDSDTESVNSSSASSDASTTESKCPIRWMMTGMFETNHQGVKPAGCPLRRVQLWHTIPLCLLAIINLLLVILALLGLAGYRVAMGLQVFLLGAAKIDLEYLASSTEEVPASIETKH